jgi:hypothetical protein
VIEVREVVVMMFEGVLEKMLQQYHMDVLWLFQESVVFGLD